MKSWRLRVVLPLVPAFAWGPRLAWAEDPATVVVPPAPAGPELVGPPLMVTPAAPAPEVVEGEVAGLIVVVPTPGQPLGVPTNLVRVEPAPAPSPPVRAVDEEVDVYPPVFAGGGSAGGAPAAVAVGPTTPPRPERAPRVAKPERGDKPERGAKPERMPAVGRPPREKGERAQRMPAERDPSGGLSPAAEVYNARAVPFGAVRLGLGQQRVGVVPRVEVGTVAVADVLGAPTLTGRLSLIERQKVELGVRAGGVITSFEEPFDSGGGASSAGVRGGRASVVVGVHLFGPLSLYGSGGLGGAQMVGLPPEGGLLDQLFGVSGESLTQQAEDSIAAAGGAEAIQDPRLDAQGVHRHQLWSGAVVLRLGENHQLIGQGSLAKGVTTDLRGAMIADGYARLIEVPGQVSGYIPGLLGEETLVSGGLSYQFAPGRWRFRVGAGWSSSPYVLWIPASVEASYQIGPFWDRED